jgi:serine/threonine protein kinase
MGQVWRTRLVREARVASKLSDPNICTIYDVGEDRGCTYTGMELVEGPTPGAPPCRWRRAGWLAYHSTSFPTPIDRRSARLPRPSWPRRAEAGAVDPGG